MDSKKSVLMAFLLLGAGTLSACDVKLREIGREETSVERQMESLILEGPMVLTEDTQIHAEKIVISKSFSLYTRGYRFSLQAHQLVVEEGGSIQNFDKSNTAGKMIDGASGGEIRLAAVEAVGFLKVSLRGQNGGEGRQSGVRGTDGRRGGNAGSFFAEFERSDSFYISIENSGGSGGPGGPGAGGTGFGGGIGGMGGVRGNPGPAGAQGRICIKKDRETPIECRS